MDNSSTRTASMITLPFALESDRPTVIAPLFVKVKELAKSANVAPESTMDVNDESPGESFWLMGIADPPLITYGALVARLLWGVQVAEIR